MDVLRPSLVWIGPRCYRKNTIVQTETQIYAEEEEPCFDAEAGYRDDVCDSRVDLEETDNGYRIAMAIPSAFHKHIIGRKAETKKRLETETRTKISVPKQGTEGDVVITGRERCGVLSARTRIEILVDSARLKAPFTHFISFPVTGQTFTDRFHIFKREVLKSCAQARGLDESIFQNPQKLHLTVGTLTLLSEGEIQKASELLQSCNETIIRPILGDEPLVVTFEGLEYMNDDPSMVDVLYAKVNIGADRLQRLADGLVSQFVSAGLMAQEYERIKLHVTIINSLMRKDPSGSFAPAKSGQKRHVQERESFDATQLLQVFGDYDFGEHHVNTVHLSQRYSAGPDGYYSCASNVTLP